MIENNNQDQEDLSRLLDRALSSYLPEEPLGLSQRVLGHVKEDRLSRQQRRAFLLAFAFAGLCLTVIAWVVLPEERSSPNRLAPRGPVLSASRPAERHVRPAVESSPEYRDAQASSPRTVRRKLAGLSRVSRSRPSFPKLDQFPAPTPLTDEERALLRVPAQQAADWLVSRRTRENVPITIKPLQIKPF